MPAIRSVNCNLFIEILSRVLLIGLFCYMETLPPFTRVIPQWEMETLKYPRTESYVPNGMLWAAVLAVPAVCSVLACVVYDDCVDAFEMLLAWSLSLGITGVLTDLVKVVVGRPRPDFFYRCYPDGAAPPAGPCTGDPQAVLDGRKSFPSGHSSLSWCSLGMLALWLCGRLGALGRHRGCAPRVLACLAPLVGALSVALSRSCDYHHHWEDILVGSLLGYFVSLFCYRQYYNPLSSDMCGVPYITSGYKQMVKPDSPVAENSSKESSPLLNSRKEDKWI